MIPLLVALRIHYLLLYLSVEIRGLRGVFACGHGVELAHLLKVFSFLGCLDRLAFRLMYKFDNFLDLAVNVDRVRQV